MVGDPGIEPGVRLREGVTVPCHTLRPVAHFAGRISALRAPLITSAPGKRQPQKSRPEIGLRARPERRILHRLGYRGLRAMKKPKWVVGKEQAKKVAAAETVWLFGLHAVRDALLNPDREKLRLIVTLNAQNKLADAITASGMTPEEVDPRKFTAPLDPGSVHQGAALEVKPLDWGDLETLALGDGARAPRVILLDRVTDPHNVGAILRSAEVFGACAVIAPRHHSAPETGALAKTASGALERQPYKQVRNLSDAIRQLQKMGYFVVGLDGEADQTIEQALEGRRDRPVALVLGAEGPGLRPKTRETCDILVKIAYFGPFGSLNVSNAAAVALYASQAPE
jgi:23S rRNA (guanosine2251-2'-O)-methyltransferase